MATSTDSGLPERYSDAQLIARGGMGEVWKARDDQLSRAVAIKVLRDGGGGEPDATRRARFEREARSIAQLSSHPSIVTVFDIGTTDAGLPFMTMQWLGGGTLADVDPDEVASDEVSKWIGQVADGLDAAHAAGIVHRDVKPGNVLLDGEGNARIGDFGIATVHDETSAALTQTGALIGTASYMSPEQAEGRAAGPRSDQYALASIAYELVTGTRPFMRESAVAELAAHVSEPVTPPSRLVTGVGPAVDRVFERALAKDPQDRYPDCREFAGALAAALSNGATLPVTASSAPTLVTARPRYVESRTPSRWNRPGLLVAAIAFLVLAAAAVALAGRDPDAAGGERPAATGETPTATDPTPDDIDEPESAPAVEADPAPDPEPVASTPSRSEAIAMHERAFQLLQAGRNDEALALATEALGLLAGVEPYEAYANYNVGASLVGLGRCEEAMPYLDRSQLLQGERREIDQARDACAGHEDDERKRDGKKRDEDEGDGDD